MELNTVSSAHRPIAFEPEPYYPFVLHTDGSYYSTHPTAVRYRAYQSTNPVALGTGLGQTYQSSNAITQNLEPIWLPPTHAITQNLIRFLEWEAPYQSTHAIAIGAGLQTTIAELKEDDKTCSICLDSIFGTCDKTNCSHFFHTECIGEWKKKSYTCPLCRSC